MDVYLQEYSAEDAVARYTSRTAGTGIRYLLENDYAEVYLSAIRDFLKAPSNAPLRLLEFGCGGGMNIISLLALLERGGRSVELAIGTDFSERLILAAKGESRNLLSAAQQEKMHFVVARNETIAADLRRTLDVSAGELDNSFGVILGINTFRYCHRLGNARECARDLATLLAPGGICIMIDMNRRFPAFRSRFRDCKTKPEAERYLPSLDEYAAPFEEVGLEVLRKENFCWIPHSAGLWLTRFCRLLTPALNLFAKPMAMRSLVVSRKRA
jgi:SAM-dependent methyltransferase